jgi:hypothetical protein
MLPLTSLFASANQDEKKHSLTLLEKTRQILFKSGSKLRSVITDSQCSDGKIRMAADEAVIPYPANQNRGAENLLRVDKKFRTYGHEDQKKEYHERPHIEAVNFSENSIQHGLKQGQRTKERCLLCPLQHTLFSSQ